MRDNAGIVYRAPIYGGSGYADECLGVLLGLHEAGLPVQTLPLGDQEDSRKLLPAESRAVLDRMKNNRVDLSRSIFCQAGTADCFDIQMRGRLQIGRTMFETDRLPAGWIDYLRPMDEVWIASRFLVDVFTRAGVPEKKLRIVSRGVDTNAYRPGTEPMKIPGARSFNFLSVFDWHYRKGPDVLLRAYLSEFKADEDVALILKVYQINNSTSDVEAEIADFIEREMGLTLEDTPPIILINGFLPNSDMPSLYAASNAFVLPTRGEGWGQPFIEALACECAVIATRWSGQVDFLDDENSYLIDIDGLAVAPPDIDTEIVAGHRWAAPSVDHLRELMRHVFRNPQEAHARARRGREQMVDYWSWPVCGRRWAREFQRLLG